MQGHVDDPGFLVDLRLRFSLAQVVEQPLASNIETAWNAYLAANGTTEEIVNPAGGSVRG